MSTFFYVDTILTSFEQPFQTPLKERLPLGWFNMDFGQFGWLRHHQLQKGFEQAFTPDPDVVHELKEAQVERQFFL